jgi:hypothetical protein
MNSPYGVCMPVTRFINSHYSEYIGVDVRGVNTIAMTVKIRMCGGQNGFGLWHLDGCTLITTVNSLQKVICKDK